MLTKGDDFPLHQTPEPVAFSGSDRNFYDRYWFNGYFPDGKTFFGLAFGIYPNVNLADAHFAVIQDGVEYCIHASRHLDMERFDLQVGPIRIIVEEPLQRLRLIVAPETGISAELVFEGRAFPIKEPRFTYRNGPRVIFDYTRMTQNGHYTGWIEVDGQRVTLPAGSAGTRDRSWGIRPLGAADPQPQVPARERQTFWRWIPLHFPTRSIFFHVNKDPDGSVWNSRATIVPDGGGEADMIECSAELETPILPGTRHAINGILKIKLPGEPDIRITLEPQKPYFQMRGAGYGTPGWTHGTYKGALVVEREDMVLTELDPGQPPNFHIQAFSKATLQQDGRETEIGFGAFEQLIIGPYAPLGLKDGTALFTA